MYTSNEYKQDKLLSLTGTGAEREMAKLRCIHYEHGRIDEADRLLQQSAFANEDPQAFYERTKNNVFNKKRLDKWEKQPRRRITLIVLIILSVLMISEFQLESLTFITIILLLITIIYAVFYFDNYG